MSDVTHRRLKIHVRDVPEDTGLNVLAVFDPHEWNMAHDDIRPPETITVDLHATVEGERSTLLVQAEIVCDLQCTCARCLLDFAHHIDKQCIFTYDVSQRRLVDITDDVREEIMLEYPMIVRCQDDCRGLCNHCGQNLNEDLCTHHSEPKE